MPGGSVSKSKFGALVPLGIAAVAIVAGLGCAEADDNPIGPPSDEPVSPTASVETRS